MKKTKQRILSLVLVLALLIPLGACGGKSVGKIRIGNNGLATWNAVKGAVHYEYRIVDADHVDLGSQTTTETRYQLPEGFSIHVRPVFEDGSAGTWSTSGYYGEPALWSDLDPGDAVISIDENGWATWDPVDGAVHYIYCITDAASLSLGEEVTAETRIQLPEGFCVHVQPVFEDGSYGSWIISDYYGEPALWSSPIQEMPPDEVSLEITIDENGWATWDAVDGAVRYEYKMIDFYGACAAAGEVTEPTVRVYADHCVDIRAVLENGGSVSGRSAYRGEQPPEMDINSQIHWAFSTKYEDTQTWSLMENIRFETLRETGEGLTFTATAPDGSDMRFVTTEGVTIREGEITLEPMSRVYALDAIGRICAYAPVISDPGENGTVLFSGGYSFTGERSVESLDDLFTVWGTTLATSAAEDPQFAYLATQMLDYQPNMVGFGAFGGYGQSAFSLSDFIVYYDEATYATPIGELYLYYNFYGSYLAGQLYDPGREVYDPDSDNYTFYLMLMPKLLDEIDPRKPDFMVDPTAYIQRAVIDIAPERYEIGDLKDADGNVMNEQTDPLTVGCTLEIIIGGATYDLELPIIARAAGVQTLHEQTPYGNTFSAGDVTPLVVPVQWSDYADPTPEESMDKIRGALGRVVDEAGDVTDHSTDIYSLSAYYDAVSGGSYHIESFLTDWVTMPYTYEEAMAADLVTHPLPDEIFAAAQAMYPDMDWSRFDSNGDGIVDAVIYISASPDRDSYIPASIAGGVQQTRGYDDSRAGTPEDPNLKDFAAIGLHVLSIDDRVILHEYGHFFGLIDYYDVTYSGIDAVGGFDMQSGNSGDWNAYSKYSVGWIEPEVVTGLTSGQSVEITIGSQSETGDAIVIPAAGADFDGPFGEYMLVDLFTATGVNEEDAAARGLAGVAGVRIYHVNANMEQRTVTNLYGDRFTIGTANIANEYKASGRYHLELLQRGGNNTFTDLSDLRSQLAPQDFFRAGDVFDAARYSEFLTGGRMDDGREFGYTIEIVRIEAKGAESTATIRITRK